jgi:hypothetical protein
VIIMSSPLVNRAYLLYLFIEDALEFCVPIVGFRENRSPFETAEQSKLPNRYEYQRCTSIGGLGGCFWGEPVEAEEGSFRYKDLIDTTYVWVLKEATPELIAVDLKSATGYDRLIQMDYNSIQELYLDYIGFGL